MKYKIMRGDNYPRLKKFKSNSTDAIITDPPYGIGFLGKDWDKFEVTHQSKSNNKSNGWKWGGKPGAISSKYYKGGLEFQEFTYRWAKQAIRVLKPGGFLLAFGSTRTHHRLICGLEDAGFEIRDCIMWLTGQGFPKSLNISKTIDRKFGKKQKLIGRRRHPTLKDVSKINRQHSTQFHGKNPIADEWNITAPTTKEAREWEGWGTALKPSCEIIVVARKPIEGTVADNVLKYGTGGLNIDACRIGSEIRQATAGNRTVKNGKGWGIGQGGDSYIKGTGATYTNKGRWPANVTHDGSEDVLEAFNKFGDRSSSRINNANNPIHKKAKNGPFWQPEKGRETNDYRDSGSAARFYYCSKVSRSERNEVVKNNHPTLKPIALMEWLIKLVTPPNGIVLDPFMGSGTTGCAALKLGFNFIGIEQDHKYYKIARIRIKHYFTKREEPRFALKLFTREPLHEAH